MEPYEILARLAEHGVPPDGDLALRMSVGLDDTLQRFKDETLYFISGGGAELKFCYGPYGRGKTHLLKSLQALARSLGFVTAYIDCRAEQSPFSSLEETYRMIVACMEPPGETDGLGIDAVIRARINCKDDQDSVMKRLHSEHKLELGFKNLLLSYVETMYRDEEVDLRNSIKTLLLANSAYRINISSLYQKYPQLPGPLGKLSKRNANLWIRSLASLPFIMNYQGLVIFFDETEKSHHMTSFRLRKQHQHLVNIRNLVDHVAVGNFCGCAFFFAVVEDFIQIASSSLGALAQRIERLHPDRRNPRAVWTSLDELTSPDPDHPEFYEQLGERVIDIALSAGMTSYRGSLLKNEILEKGRLASQDVSIGAVREFVKFAASRAAEEIDT
jgi:hypothetical protein